MVSKITKIIRCGKNHANFLFIELMNRRKCHIFRPTLTDFACQRPRSP